MRKTDVSNAKNQDILHDTALTPDVMNVMNMDISSWNAPIGYPLQEHQHHTTRHIETATQDHALDTTGKTEKEETGPDHSLDTADTAAPAIVTCTEAAPDHNNMTASATIEAAQDDPVQHTEHTVAGPAMTHHTGHTANPPHTATHQATALRTAANHIHAHPTDHQSKIHIKEDNVVWDYTPIREPQKSHPKKGT